MEFGRLFCPRSSPLLLFLCAVAPALSAAMHLMMYLNEKGERVYTLKVCARAQARRQQLQAKARMRGVLQHLFRFGLPDFTLPLRPHLFAALAFAEGDARRQTDGIRAPGSLLAR